MSHVGMDLPNDILFSILSVLPVKSLLRFMCVCKLWNSLIKSSAFIHHHHRVNRNDNDKNSYLLYMPDDRCRDNSVCNILHERYTASSYIMHGDLVLPSRRYSAVGVYEGLICMTEKSHNAKHIYIWNPLVGALKHVPPSEMEPPHKYKNVALGFGFAKDDYKIVKIIFNDKWCLHKVEMYSLGANSWRIIECEPAKWRIYDWLCSGVLFEGSIYWLSRTENGHGASTSLLRFDLEEEIFEETALLMHSPFNPDLELIVENGFLVVLRRYHDEGASVKGWVKKESSWIASEEFVLPKNKIYPLIEVSNSGHLVFTARDEADTWTGMQLQQPTPAHHLALQPPQCHIPNNGKEDFKTLTENELKSLDLPTIWGFYLNRRFIKTNQHRKIKEAEDDGVSAKEQTTSSVDLEDNPTAQIGREGSNSANKK
ncbi:hypothetical protein BUALT_Bualt18G0046500 [Buddleja alternifolia]|uniref:F-box domain-containing protein n=1 Tax=Buddleja alternifolia TaxID=168488 RepID=A0AAV6W4K4_9LAMI|nr:hypothetical protein BUALT_Bualt18G0046500 [Buddleja alternifolia]